MLNGLKCFIHRWPILAKFRIVNNRHVFENVEATSEAYLSESARSPEYPPSYACVACLGGVNHFVILACRTTTSAVHLEIMTPRWTCFTNNLLYLGLFARHIRLQQARAGTHNVSGTLRYNLLQTCQRGKSNSGRTQVAVSRLCCYRSCHRRPTTCL